jgi:Rrf2 family protein
MKLSARSRYAARILLELAKHKEQTPVSATILSQHTGVSVQFVEQILKPLKQKGLTASQRGASGGHFLARPASEITLGQIVRLMEGGICLSVCCGERAENCSRKQGCLTRRAWVSVSLALEQELDAISIADLLHEEEVCSQVCGDVEPPVRADVAGKPANKGPRVLSVRKVKGLHSRIPMGRSAP